MSEWVFSGFISNKYEVLSRCRGFLNFSKRLDIVLFSGLVKRPHFTK